MTPEKNKDPQLILEIALMLVGGIVVYVVARRYDILERIAAFSWEHENLEIDEILAVTLFLSFASLFLLIRRWKNLKNVLSEINQLRGMIPMCAVCKKVRNDDGYWQQVEAYISAHTAASFSHGFCPECMRKLYPEYADE